MKVSIEQTGNPTADLKRISRVRHDLWRRRLTEGALMGAHRDRNGRLFFKVTGDIQKIRDAVEAGTGAAVEEVREAEGDECLNCGNCTGDPLPTVCPSCNFRDITPCPHCSEEVPRQLYEEIAAALFRCPRCQARVRMEFNPDLFDDAGYLNAPAVIVRSAGG